MSISVTDQSNVAIYDTVTGRPYGLVFESEDHALDFLAWFHKRRPEDDIRNYSRSGWTDIQRKWWTERLDEDGFLRE